MTLTMQDLEKKLSDEKFDGGPLRWKDETWERCAVQLVEDDKFWYMRLHQGNIIFSYSKNITPKTVPHCLECNTVIEGVLHINTVHDNPLGGVGGYGNTDPIYIPHCKKCEPNSFKKK
jgi:hypothetical protein